ncbi:hypothetical protein QTO30_09545 [Yoonia sp. GPGPB17]|uniref:hypothetical protein n=1 Tax=Yoonia sp. GPGPB17 TaxID=3026147 RepID=UPI0030BCED9F
MQTISITPERLIARATPWPIVFSVCIVLFAMVFTISFGFSVGEMRLNVSFAFLLLCSWLFVLVNWRLNFVTVIFDRRQDSIVIRYSDPFSSQENTYTLSDLIEANVWDDLSPSALLYAAVNRAGRSPSRLVLIFSDEDSPRIEKIPGWLKSDTATIETANAINAWLSRTVDSENISA